MATRNLARKPPGMVLKPCKYWDKLPINWCRISSINSMNWPVTPYSSHNHGWKNGGPSDSFPWNDASFLLNHGRNGILTNLTNKKQPKIYKFLWFPKVPLEFLSSSPRCLGSKPNQVPSYPLGTQPNNSPINLPWENLGPKAKWHQSGTICYPAKRACFRISKGGWNWVFFLWDCFFGVEIKLFLMWFLWVYDVFLWVYRLVFLWVVFCQNKIYR